MTIKNLSGTTLCCFSIFYIPEFVQKKKNLRDYMIRYVICCSFHNDNHRSVYLQNTALSQEDINKRRHNGMSSHRVLCLGIILLYCKLLHPVRVHFHGLLFSLHQQCWRALATALPQGIHHISQIGDDVARALQHARVLKSRNRRTLMTWQLMVKMLIIQSQNKAFLYTGAIYQ